MSALEDEMPNAVFERLQDFSLLLKGISREDGIAAFSVPQDEVHTC